MTTRTKSRLAVAAFVTALMAVGVTVAWVTGSTLGPLGAVVAIPFAVCWGMAGGWVLKKVWGL